jgi:hypothetical protein
MKMKQAAGQQSSEVRYLIPDCILVPSRKSIRLFVV